MVAKVERMFVCMQDYVTTSMFVVMRSKLQSVVCVFTLPAYTGSPTVTTPGLFCYEYQLRLTNETYTTINSTQVYQGNAEICINGTFVAICDLGWDDVEAQLVCNSLGYTEPFFRELT